MAVLRKREVWLDNVKVIACIFVVLGHFFQSMVKTGLMHHNPFYQWFDSTIYTFHVPLFFICSGYLFQKYSRIDSIKDWSRNAIKKFISLGVPYFAFSIVTWLLKKSFSSSVNRKIGSLSDTLFVNPTSPYWYLYILFFIFLITITTRNKNIIMIMFVLSAICKVITVVGFYSNIYFIDKLLSNWIWFVLGTVLAYGIIKVSNVLVGIALLVIFFTSSVVFFANNVSFVGKGLALGLIACYSIVCIIYNCFKDGKQSRIFAFCAQYTMPVFLMHTIFAATLRSILIKVGIYSLGVHIVCGIVISFVGPIVAMFVMEKIKPLDFVVYPMKYIKL